MSYSYAERLNCFGAPRPLPILIPGNFTPVTDFQLVEALTRSLLETKSHANSKSGLFPENRACTSKRVVRQVRLLLQLNMKYTNTLVCEILRENH